MTIDEFQKADLRVGTILEAVRVEGSEKLMKMQVDIGEQDESGARKPRQILAGVALSYAPEDLVARQIVVIANLEPRVLMGLESQGMLLAPSDSEGKPVVLMPDRAVEPGAKIK
jgi:methionyl-tRNA synthetase